MKIKENLYGVLLASTLLGASFTTQAASVSLLVAEQTSATVSVEYWMDFTNDPTLGGGTDVFYDNTILGDDWTFAFDTTFLTLVDDPTDPPSGFTQLPTLIAPGAINNIMFGTFNGVGGNNLVGTLVFNIAGGGTTALTMGENILAGPFASSVYYTAQAVDYNNTSVVTTVPLPAAAWLMLSGLGAVFGFCKRKSNVASV